jgi:hypothetical protein
MPFSFKTLTASLAKMNHRCLYCLAVFCAWMVTTYLAAMIPMHSDDYGYFLAPLNPSAIIDVYFSWTGRIIPEILARILNKQSALLKAALSGLCVTMLLCVICSIPTRKPGEIEDNREHHRFKTLLFVLIFFLYYLLNPALGETTFWVTGAANYLWPALFFVLFLKYTLEYVKNRKIYFLIISGILSIIVGLSNEGTSPVSVCFVLCLLWINRYDTNLRKGLIILAICGIVCCIILYISPGNFIRVAQEKPEMLSLYKIITYIPRSFNKNILQESGKFLSLVILLFCIILKNKYIIKNINTEQIRILLILSILLIADMLILVPFSPSRRAILPLFIISICVITSQLLILEELIKYIYKKISYFLYMCCIIIFTYKIYLIFIAYDNIREQQMVREYIVKSSQKNNNIKVPDFYYTKLLSRYDRVDKFTGYAHAMSAFYNVNNIKFYNIEFNYGVINKIHNIYKEDDKLFNIYTHNDGVFNKYTIIIGIKSEHYAHLDQLHMKLYTIDNNIYDMRNGIYIDNIIYFGGSYVNINKYNIKYIELYNDDKMILLYHNNL